MRIVERKCLEGARDFKQSKAKTVRQKLDETTYLGERHEAHKYAKTSNVILAFQWHVQHRSDAILVPCFNFAQLFDRILFRITINPSMVSRAQQNQILVRV
ncbi:hypothetical protein BMUNKI379_21740 [Burkholderia multivorans]|nr:hypothetical protein BMUNKI379_21740 [Burkholderia multivorans]